jgi:translocator assembly and maintenance protein 41
VVLPARFTELELYEQIAGISYAGDPRMSVPGAENPEKVKNIVRGEGALEGFRVMYGDLLAEIKEVTWDGKAGDGNGENMLSVSPATTSWT